MKEKTRQPFLFGLLTIASILTFSFYLEYARDIFPCLLCELQRLIFFALGVFFLFGTLLHHIRFIRYSMWSIISLTSTLGIIVATRQVWLQFFPEMAHGACGAGLSQLLKILPLRDVFAQILEGSAECTEKGWVFLKLDLAEWALILFISYLFYALFHFMKEWRKRA